MEKKKGALSADLLDFDTLELDASLSCPGKRDSSCAQWDHTVQLFVCCDHTSPYCNMELGRWITAFRRYKARGKHSDSTAMTVLNNHQFFLHKKLLSIPYRK